MSGSDDKAMQLITFYSMNTIVRYIAIDKVASQSGFSSSVDGFTLISNRNKIVLLFQSKETKLNLLNF